MRLKHSRPWLLLAVARRFAGFSEGLEHLKVVLHLLQRQAALPDDGEALSAHLPRLVVEVEHRASDDIVPGNGGHGLHLLAGEINLQ